MISVPFQGKPFNIIVIQVYAPTTNAKETEAEQFYEDLSNYLEITPLKKKNKSRDITLSFLRLHPSTPFQTLLQTMIATQFLLRDSSPQ